VLPVPPAAPVAVVLAVDPAWAVTVTVAPVTVVAVPVPPVPIVIVRTVDPGVIPAMLISWANSPPPPPPPPRAFVAPADPLPPSPHACTSTDPASRFDGAVHDPDDVNVCEANSPPAPSGQQQDKAGSEGKGQAAVIVAPDSEYVPCDPNTSAAIACTIPDPSADSEIADPPDDADSWNESPDGDLT